MKRLLLMLALAALLQAQTGTVQPYSLADITCDSAAHSVQSSGSARWVQIIAASGGSGVRTGDSNVGASRGLLIAAGGGFLYPPIPSDPRESVPEHLYSLASIYYYCTSGSVEIVWAK